MMIIDTYVSDDFLRDLRRHLASEVLFLAQVEDMNIMKPLLWL